MIPRVQSRDTLLSFAEAMALPPSEVEVQIGAVWILLSEDAGGLSLRTLREKEFRRVRTRVSRVEEMAERRTFHPYYGIEDFRKLVPNLYTEAIAEVCAFFRSESTSPLGDATARALEREFLEKR